jgi:diguanylate cyclase (GGDEF)-like protein
MTEIVQEPNGLDVPSANRSRIGLRQRGFAASTIVLLVLIGIIGTPFAGLPIVAVPGTIAILDSAMFVISLLTAALLFMKGEIESRSDTTRLGAAYLFVTLIILSHIASFPGGLMPTALIGASSTPVWVWFAWHVGFGLGVIRYAWFTSRPRPSAASWKMSVVVVLALVALATWISASRTEQLPIMLAASQFVFTGAALGCWLLALGVTGGALLSVVSLRWTTPERLWLVVAMVANCLDVWLKFQGTARYTFGWYLSGVADLVAALVVLISLLYEIHLLYRESATSNAALHELVRLDGLTGLINRRGFDERLDEEFRRARRLEMPLSLVLVDVDFFKAYNDHYGHQAGDDCLRRVSAAIKGALWRPGDHAARYGGEEIVILLPATDMFGAMLIAGRAVDAVAALDIPHLASPFGTVSISAGVGSMLPLQSGDTAADLMKSADHALYQAKKEGRNRICSGTADSPAIPAMVSDALESQAL